MLLQLLYPLFGHAPSAQIADEGIIAIDRHPTIITSLVEFGNLGAGISVVGEPAMVMVGGGVREAPAGAIVGAMSSNSFIFL